MAYVALPVASRRVGDAVRGLVALGFRGANVTMPYKAAVMPFLDTVADDRRAPKRSTPSWSTPAASPATTPTSAGSKGRCASGARGGRRGRRPCWSAPAGRPGRRRSALLAGQVCAMRGGESHTREGRATLVRASRRCSRRPAWRRSGWQISCGARRRRGRRARQRVALWEWGRW